jgi:hypothetical protein
LESKLTYEFITNHNAESHNLFRSVNDPIITFKRKKVDFKFFQSNN